MFQTSREGSGKIFQGPWKERKRPLILISVKDMEMECSPHSIRQSLFYYQNTYIEMFACRSGQFIQVFVRTYHPGIQLSRRPNWPGIGYLQAFHRSKPLKSLLSLFDLDLDMVKLKRSSSCSISYLSRFSQSSILQALQATRAETQCISLRVVGRQGFLCYDAEPNPNLFFMYERRSRQ